MRRWAPTQWRGWPPRSEQRRVGGADRAVDGRARTTTVAVTVDEVAEESDTTDNCSASVKVDVEEPPKYPDLEVGTPTVDEASPETGATFTLSATVSNAGDAESAATTLRYYRSTDATITTSDTAGRHGRRWRGLVRFGDVAAASVDLTAPSDPRTRTTTARAWTRWKDESDTTNNCSTVGDGDGRRWLDAASSSPNLVVDVAFGER